MKKIVITVLIMLFCCSILSACGTIDIYTKSEELIEDDIHDNIASMALLTYGSVTTEIDILSMEEDENTTVSIDTDVDEIKAYKIEGTYELKELNSGTLVNSGSFDAIYSAVRKGSDVVVTKSSLDWRS